MGINLNEEGTQHIFKSFHFRSSADYQNIKKKIKNNQKSNPQLL